MKHKKLALILMLPLLLHAEGMTIITVSGVLIDGPECTVNTDNSISVDFGEGIITRKIDGNNYQQELKYTMVCEDPFSYAMKLTLKGEPAKFDNTLLATDVEGLGIRLIYNNNPISPGAYINFIYPSFPAIFAAPMAQDPLELTSSPFTGNATMVIDYQ